MKRWLTDLFYAYVGSIIVSIGIFIYCGAISEIISVLGIIKLLTFGGLAGLIPMFFIIVGIRDAIIPLFKDFVNGSIYQKFLIILIMVTLFLLKFSK